MTDTPTRTNAPTLRWAVRLLAVEAGLLGVLAVLVGVALATTTVTSKQGGGAVLAITLIFAIIVGSLARALSNLKAWARGPAIVLEMLLIPIGYYMLDGLPYVGIPAMIAGLFGAGLLLAPSTRTALGIDHYRDR